MKDTTRLHVNAYFPISFYLVFTPPRWLWLQPSADASHNIALQRHNLIRQNFIDPNSVSVALGNRKEDGWMVIRHQADVIYGLFSRASS